MEIETGKQTEVVLCNAMYRYSIFRGKSLTQLQLFAPMWHQTPFLAHARLRTSSLQLVIARTIQKVHNLLLYPPS